MSAGCRGIYAWGGPGEWGVRRISGLVRGVVEVDVSQRERAVARKNVSLSRRARSSCSWGLSGRVTLRLRPGVEVV